MNAKNLTNVSKNHKIRSKIMYLEMLTMQLNKLKV